MAEDTGEVNKEVGLPKTPEKNLEIKAPWEVTRKDFGENFYLHGASEKKAEYLRHLGTINKIGPLFLVLASDLDTVHYYASGGHDPRAKPGSIFVFPASEIPESVRFIKDYPHPKRNKHVIEPFDYAVENLKYIAEMPYDVNPHKYLIEKALKEGKNVPPEVLADYPDL